MTTNPDDTQRTCHYIKERCPKCGSTLATNSRAVWCTFVGGQDEKPCDYGIDKPVPYRKPVEP